MDKIDAMEQAELLNYTIQKSIDKNEELRPRQSGSAEWKQARGENGNS